MADSLLGKTTRSKNSSNSGLKSTSVERKVARWAAKAKATEEALLDAATSHRKPAEPSTRAESILACTEQRGQLLQLCGWHVAKAIRAQFTQSKALRR